MKPIYVIVWRYGDGSGSGAVSAHGTREGAETMLKILIEQSDSRQFEIHEDYVCDRCSSVIASYSGEIALPELEPEVGIDVCRFCQGTQVEYCDGEGGSDWRCMDCREWQG